MDAHRRKLPRSPANKNNVNIMINEEKDLLSRKISKLCSDPRDIHPAFAVGPPQHRMIVCYDKFQQIPFGAGVEHLSLCLCS